MDVQLLMEGLRKGWGGETVEKKHALGPSEKATQARAEREQVKHLRGRLHEKAADVVRTQIKALDIFRSAFEGHLQESDVSLTREIVKQVATTAVLKIVEHVAEVELVVPHLAYEIAEKVDAAQEKRIYAEVAEAVIVQGMSAAERVGRKLDTQIDSMSDFDVLSLAKLSTQHAQAYEDAGWDEASVEMAREGVLETALGVGATGDAAAAALAVEAMRNITRSLPGLNAQEQLDRLRGNSAEKSVDRAIEKLHRKDAIEADLERRTVLSTAAVR